MTEKKKTKLGEGWSPDIIGKSSSKQVEVNKDKLGEAPMAQTQIGGYDLQKEGGTVSLGRAMQIQKTKEVTDAAIERMRKQNMKP